MKVLKRWLSMATPKEADALAAKAGTSPGYLRYLSGGYRQGTGVRAGLARKIELAAAGLRKKNPALPELRRVDLNQDCAACEYAKACLKRG